MDMGDKEKFELEKRNDDPMNYHSSPGMSSDWRFSAPNLSNVSMGVIPNVNPMGSSSCSTASMVDSYSPTLWDHPNACLRSVVDRSLDMGWNHSPSSMMKGGVFFPGMLPQSLSQFPADSAFIERAARFSSFNGGSFSDMVNPFCVPEPMALYSRGVGMAQEQHEGHKNELSVAKNVSVSLEQGAMDRSPLKNGGRSESLVRSRDGATQGVGGSSNESDEAEFSGQGGQDEPSTLDDIGFKKRKRSRQETELDKTEEASQQACDSAKDKTQTPHKGDQNPTSATNKAAGKHGKSDPGKDEYIHVRARRGQATNSHSLAERVRREKISERMKFLQDLVPGCSKVTGKAVMLDEIINYVQSLQRQVEFLSMKLATVNPRLDVNIEGLLTKDILQSRPGPSSSLGYAPDMPMAYPLLQPSQPGLIRRNISPQLTPMSAGFKEPSQVPNMWEDELHNVVQMNFGTSSQDMNESNTPGQMKVEL